MMNALKISDTVTFSQVAQQSPGFVPLAKVALTYAKMGITTVDEVLKLIEMVADNKAITATDMVETSEQEYPLEITQQGVNKTTTEKKSSSSSFSFESESKTQPPGGKGGAI
jgi:MSHA biogenesis protein MshE